MLDSLRLFANPPRPIPATGFKPGSATQVVVGLLVALWSIVLYTYHQPFVSHANSMLGIVAMIQVFFTMLAGLLIKLDVTADEGYDEEVSARRARRAVCLCACVVMGARMGDLVVVMGVENGERAFSGRLLLGG